MYKYEVEEADVFDLVEKENRTDNHLFTRVSTKQMKRIVDYFSNSMIKDKGYILIDIDLDELEKIDGMIKVTEQEFVFEKNCLVEQELDKLEKALIKTGLLIHDNPDSVVPLLIEERRIKDKMDRVYREVKKERKNRDLQKYYLKSYVAEEFIMGKIIKSIMENPKLKERYNFKNIINRLAYFNNFLMMDGLIPKEYNNFKELNFELNSELPELTRDTNSELTICFTNLQNISNPIVNRIINSLTAYNNKVLRTMIFTEETDLLTRSLRDDGGVITNYDFRIHKIKSNEMVKSRIIEL